MKTVSIIVPIYNELHNVDELMRRVLAAPLPEGWAKEIIVVDDGSIDGTVQMLEKYAASGEIKLHKSILNFGKGTALRVGFRYASGEISREEFEQLRRDLGATGGIGPGG